MENSFSNLAGNWARMAPEAATRWVSSLPANSTRDRAAQSLINNLMQHDMPSAVDRLDLINEPRQRRNAEQQIAHNWLQTDPATARIWIQNSDLPTEMKTQLLNPNPGG